jgi:hypothetical protein
MTLDLLEIMRGLRSAREAIMWWKKVLGSRFAEAEEYLRPCPGTAARQIPCPTTGITLRVCEADGHYLCFPTGEEAEDAPDLSLKWEQVQAWRLDMDSAEEKARILNQDDSSQKTEKSRVAAKIIGDFKVIRIPGQKDINLGTRYRARALLRFIHEQLKRTGTTKFYIEEMRELYNASGAGRMDGKKWKSDRIREDLFRGKEREFDLLFETLDKAAGYYRMKI